jgi:hypothetical protein
VRYTVWSRGRLIGDTDLGFIRVISQARSGWFHPNGEGERLMPVIASVLPAMRAYLHRNAVDAQAQSLMRPAMHGSTEYADLADAFQHLHSLGLELRRDDGSIVPTSDIGIQDTEQLIELVEVEDDDVDAESWDADDELVAEDSTTDWMPEDLQEPDFPRYQIHVQLLREDAIP